MVLCSTNFFIHLYENCSDSVADFALELRINADKIGSDISGRILKHQLTEGLPVNIQVSLDGYTAKTNTWDKLVEKALKGENVASLQLALAALRRSSIQFSNSDSTIVRGISGRVFE